MRRLCCTSIAIAVAVLLLRMSSSAADQCLTCHEGLSDTPSTLFAHDVHRAKGITCAGCHGGDPMSDDMERAMSTDAGFIGVPKGDDISAVCAKCHSNAAMMIQQFNSDLPRNQAEALGMSVHGGLATSGKERIAQCTTCHNAHGIASVKDPASPVYPLNTVRMCTKCHADAAYMRTYNPALPVDQLEKYRTSVHGIRNKEGDTKVAECASCHGSHDIRDAKDAKSKVYPANLPATCGTCHSNPRYMKGYKIATDQLRKFSQSVHGIALLKRGDVNAPACNDCHGNHGAVPPGVESISQVCGTCHALNASLFASSPHKKAFDQRKLPECETCHGYHEIVSATDELLGVTPNATCSRCHKENLNQKGYLVAKTMRQLIDSLELSERTAAASISEAEQKGMEVSEAKFKLRDARQAWLQSRTMVHSFNLEKFREVVDKGISTSSQVASEGRHAINEYYFRRWGLGISTLIITIVGVSLYLVIRRIERRQAANK